MLQRLIPSLEGYTVSYLHALIFRWIVIGLMVALVVFAARSVLFAELSDNSPGASSHGHELVSL